MHILKDEEYMRRCLQLARNGMQNAKPNPMVGAVIVAEDGRIIGVAKVMLRLTPLLLLSQRMNICCILPLYMCRSNHVRTMVKLHLAQS